MHLMDRTSPHRSIGAAGLLAWTLVSASLVRPAAMVEKFESITFSDSGGFAGGTGVVMTVSGDGQVNINNKRSGTEKTYRLSETEIGRLNEAIARVEWKSIKERYITPGAADVIVHDLKITVNGAIYETHADRMARVPAPLRELLDELTALSRR